MRDEIACCLRIRFFIEGYMEQYSEVYISFRLSSEANKALSEAAVRSGRKKKQEAKLRLESHLRNFPLISDLNNYISQVEYEHQIHWS